MLVLPDGADGEIQVGHLNLGAGRVVPQELVRMRIMALGRSRRNAA
jgi:bisphosphoglycerate-independent phosphoglycerate mutase (AlkP superfamily)